jgi:ketosteroid isomerase-like protein
MILALEDKWRVAQHSNDVAAFLVLLSPDLTFIGTSGSLRTRSDYIASRGSSWIPRAKTYEFSELRVRVFGPVAVVTGREATTGTGVAFQGRFTHVWAEHSGEWRLVAIQRTDIAPASPPQ